MYFSSPVSSITPALTSVAMSRSDSRDSSTSASSSRAFTSAPLTVSYSTSPLSLQAPALTRTISNNSTSSNNSSSTWLTSPYRSCMQRTCSESIMPSSYLSDDDLLFLGNPSSCHDVPVTSIPNLEPSILRKKDLTTEQQIAMLRELQQKEQEQPRRVSQASQHQRIVRFAPDSNRSRRGSTQKRNAATRKA